MRDEPKDRLRRRLIWIADEIFCCIYRNLGTTFFPEDFNFEQKLSIYFFFRTFVDSLLLKQETGRVCLRHKRDHVPLPASQFDWWICWPCYNKGGVTDFPSKELFKSITQFFSKREQTTFIATATITGKFRTSFCNLTLTYLSSFEFKLLLLTRQTVMN